MDEEVGKKTDEEVGEFSRNSKTEKHGPGGNKETGKSGVSKAHL